MEMVCQPDQQVHKLIQAELAFLLPSSIDLYRYGLHNYGLYTYISMACIVMAL